MKKIDEALYFTIEEKHNQVNLTNLGLGFLADQTATDFLCFL